MKKQYFGARMFPIINMKMILIQTHSYKFIFALKYVIMYVFVDR